MSGKYFFKGKSAPDLILIYASIFAALFFCAQNLPAQSPKEFKEIFATSPALKDGQFSFYAKYANGKVISAQNISQRLTPASVLKLYTTAAALDALGPKYRFETKVYYGGVLRGGKITGGLYIKGAGDPTLGSYRVSGAQNLEELTSNWIKQIKDAGITTIEGGIYADNSIFGGVSLPWKTSYQNIGNYFAAPVDGLSVRDNSYDIYFEPALEENAPSNQQTLLPSEKTAEETSGEESSAVYRPINLEALAAACASAQGKETKTNGANASAIKSAKDTDGKAAKILKTDPQIKDFEIKSFVKYSYADSSDNAYVNFAPDGFGAEIYGTIPVTRHPVKIIAAMPNPALFFADYFKTKLQESGVRVRGKAAISSPESYDNKTLLLTHYSPELKDIIKYTNKRSFNLYAESLLRSLALTQSTATAATAGAGIKEVQNFLTRLKVDPSNYDVFDGSGLSRDDIISCEMTVNLLSAVLKKPYAQDFLDSLPVVGSSEDNGSMARKLRHSNAAYNALVKTGSLDRARAHAGYVKDAKGRQIIFCVISNNFAGPLKDVSALHESFINSLSNIGFKKKPRRAPVKAAAKPTKPKH